MVIDFRLLRGQADLPAFLACDRALVELVCRSDRADLFEVHQIPKRGRRGGRREVWEVAEDTIADLYKGLSRRLTEFLYSSVPAFPHPAAHGYVPGRSTRTNAEKHIGASLVLLADIKEFFRTIDQAKVTQALEQAGLRTEAARALSSVVTFENHLPLGLATSPVLANLICLDLDSRLARLLPGLTYTRYADDLAFSGPVLPTRAQVEAELATDGFVLADGKWRVARAGRGLFVTGLSLEDGERPRVPRGLKRRVRQELHHARKHGLVEHIGRRNYPTIQTGVNWIHGMIQYIRGIEPDVGNRFQAEWEPILFDAKLGPSYPSVATAQGSEVLLLLDESVVQTAEQKRLAIGLAVVEDGDLVRARLEEFRQSLLHDPYGVSDKAPLEKKGLHWNELSEDDRTAATNILHELPFRAFVAYTDLAAEDPRTYTSAYADLLAVLLRDRFVKYDKRPLRVLAEENSRVKGSTVKHVVDDILDKLDAGKSRRPTSVDVLPNAAKGSDAALPLPDLLLGVFGAYAKSRLRPASDVEQGAKKKSKKRPPGQQAAMRFEQVRDRIHAIFDLADGDVHSRRRPFAPW